MKVLISEFLQETNSFCPVITEAGDFKCWTSTGVAGARGNKEIDGMANVLEENGYEIVYGPLLRAQASGPVHQSVVDDYINTLMQAIADAGELDAVCLSMHGATQSTEQDDVCGEVAARVRAMIGDSRALAVSLDLHADVTQTLYENADCICGYQTYPHVDLYETGARAAGLCIRVLSGEKLYSARVGIPMIVPASGYTSNSGAFGGLVSEAHALVDGGSLVDYSIFQMQPWLDTSVGGSSVIAVAHSREAAQNSATVLAQKLAGMCGQMQPDLKTPDEIIDKAISNKTDRPVIVSDFSDSPNAGASGDSVLFLSRLIERDADVKAAIIVNDQPAVAKAFASGVGKTVRLELGGTLDKLRSRSISVDAHIRSLHDGHLILGGPVLRGCELSIGPTAVLTVGKIDILVCSSMAITGDIQLYRHFGIEPAFYQLVLVKANTSFRAAYSEVSDQFYLCDTKGSATADLASLPFKRLPESFYPFTDIDDYNALEHVSAREILHAPRR